jgi:hypothetical protein
MTAWGGLPTYGPGSVPLRAHPVTLVRGQSERTAVTAFGLGVAHGQECGRRSAEANTLGRRQRAKPVSGLRTLNSTEGDGHSTTIAAGPLAATKRLAGWGEPDMGHADVGFGLRAAVGHASWVGPRGMICCITSYMRPALLGKTCYQDLI